MKKITYFTTAFDFPYVVLGTGAIGDCNGVEVALAVCDCHGVEEALVKCTQLIRIDWQSK